MVVYYHPANGRKHSATDQDLLTSGYTGALEDLETAGLFGLERKKRLN